MYDISFSLFFLVLPLVVEGQSCPQASVTGATTGLTATTTNTPQSLTCNSGMTFPGGLTTQLFMCNTATSLWVPNPNTTICGAGCPGTPVAGATAALTAATSSSTQNLTCGIGTFPGGFASQSFVCNVALGLWVPNPATTVCNVGCPQVIVNGASAVLTATTSNVPQTLTCSNGTFPGGFTTQQFVCNTATSQWTPNPITTTCGTGCSATPVTGTTAALTATTSNTPQILSCSNGMFPGGFTTQPFICSTATGQWIPNPSTTICSVGCLATNVTGASTALNATTTNTPQNLTCANGTFPGGFTSQQFICNPTANQWIPNPTTTTCSAACPQTAVTLASAVLTATTSNTPQILTCSSGFFPSGFTSQQFICNTAVGQWVPNPSTTTCNTGCPATYVTGTTTVLNATTSNTPQILTCVSGATFPGGFNTQPFLCNTVTYQWIPSPTTTICSAGCPTTVVPGASAGLNATTTNTPQTLTCASGTFPGGLTTQQFICNTAYSQWVPSPITTTCGEGCPAWAVAGASTGLIAATSTVPQTLTCINGTFPSGSSTQQFVCNTTASQWIPSPNITTCSITTKATSSATATPVMCTKSPVYAVAENEIREAFCQLLRRCPNNIWDWSAKYKNSYFGMQDIVKAIATSDEFYKKNLANSSDIIVVLYQKLLVRNPEPVAATIWYQQMKIYGWKYVATALLSTTEYTQKFGKLGVPGAGVLSCCC